MKSNYTFYHYYVSGFKGQLYFNFLKELSFNNSRNFRGKPLSVTISSEINIISIEPKRPDFVYFINLQYNIKNKFVEEINSGEIL